MSGALSSRELREIQRDIEMMMLPDSCNILTATLAADGYGGMTETWGTAYAGVYCRLDPLTGKEAAGGDALRAFNTFQLTLPYNATITTDNRVEVNGGTFNVVTVDPEKSWKVCKRAKVERI